MSSKNFIKKKIDHPPTPPGDRELWRTDGEHGADPDDPQIARISDRDSGLDWNLLLWSMNTMTFLMSRFRRVPGDGIAVRLLNYELWAALRAAWPTRLLCTANPTGVGRRIAALKPVTQLSGGQK